MIRALASMIWNLSEKSGIGLGKAAPYVFGLMVGAKSMTKTKEDGKQY